MEPDLYLYLGYVLGSLSEPRTAAAFVAVLASDREGEDRVWRHTRRLRDQLTALLQAAGREEAK